MLGGQLLGRITAVAGESGFTPYFRLPVSLNYQNHQSPAAVLDVVNTITAVYFTFSRNGSPAQQGPGSYFGPAYLNCIGAFGTITVGGPGPSWAFLIPADHGLLHRIEAERRGRDVILRLEITVAAVVRPAPNNEPPIPSGVAVGQVHGAEMQGNPFCSYEISKSKWLELLKAVGYGEFYMAEIPLPQIKKVKALDASLQHIQRAWEHFLNGNDREALAACHDALEKLAKESLGAQSKPDQNAFAKILAGTGPPEKVQKVALLLRQCADLLHLGRHEHKPSVELDHRDAELGILLTHACVAYLSRTPAMNKQSRQSRSPTE